MQHLCTSAFRSSSNLNSINGPMQQPPDPGRPAADVLVFPNAITGCCDSWICPLTAIHAVSPRQVNPQRVERPASHPPLNIEAKAFRCPLKTTCLQSLASGGHVHCEQSLLLKTHVTSGLSEDRCVKHCPFTTLSHTHAHTHPSLTHFPCRPLSGTRSTFICEKKSFPSARSYL